MAKGERRAGVLVVCMCVGVHLLPVCVCLLCWWGGWLSVMCLCASVGEFVPVFLCVCGALVVLSCPVVGGAV